MRQEIEKRKAAWELKKEVVKQLKAERDFHKQEAQNKRLQEKLTAINSLCTINEPEQQEQLQK